MPVEIDTATQHCTLIADRRRFSGSAKDVHIVTDENLRMSVAILDENRVPITEHEADALTVAGAFDGRKHLKETSDGSVI
ncbi:MAG: DUF3203 family protein [Pseudomonas sp.]|uniref:DUF3203 family protein n=1 Tax=Pseudomonas abieticivorans TaxID=2931382 RepID=UPI0020BDA69E|nr:DUF3203 family protein [Pseudomonas sp. PIA16]MDE1166590.1 DUF3203 family protein [Pseudomonas sp.]